jgi:hypothetical protein
MLTESADIRLDLFRKGVDDVAEQIDAALRALRPRRFQLR